MSAAHHHHHHHNRKHEHKAGRPLVLITGATGHIGSEVAKFVNDHDHYNTRILVRDPAKTPELANYGQLVKGDFTDVASLDAALKGVHALFLALPFVSNALDLAKAAVDAAKRAGVKHIVKLSAIGANPDTDVPVVKDHAHQEKVVKESGISYTILQPTFFQENLIFYSAQELKNGSFSGASGGVNKYPPVSVQDIGEVAAIALKHADKYNGQTLVLTGSELFNDNEIAALLSKELNKPIVYKDFSLEDYGKTLASHGVPEFNAKSLVGLQGFIRAGYTGSTTDTVEKVTGHKPVPLFDRIREHRAALA